ncbi:hypothetical protein HAHE_39260 [Haloferula helveola]|uniref:FecR protein domain-containing protein n=1 Tax=Haloferula helveola TaxID=490095 RepID=A0ABM7RPM7_9BACT|nr:hypothetical protein HAHE_39260 [Haloferula helveola]
MKPEEAIARILANTADPGEVEEVIRQLKADPEALRRFVELAEIDGLIGPALEDDLRRERRFQAVEGAVRHADREDFVAGVRQRIRIRQAARYGMAVAATVVIGLFLSWLLLPENRGPVMATIQRTESVPEGSLVKAGTALVAGDSVIFESGLAELQVGDKGTMVLEGPAELRFDGPMRAVLNRGRVVMRVTEAGHGFEVATPKGKVIDLGTEFGVAVTDDGEVETHVLDGEVEAVPDSGPKVRLTKANALRFGDATTMVADSTAFYTKLPPLHRETPSGILWRFDEGNGHFSESDPEGDPMVFHAESHGQSPEWVDGVFGEALALDGKGGYLESGFRGIGGADPRTVCFWVKVPEDFSIKQGFGIVSWGHWRSEGWGEVWQISVNPLEEEGLVGGLRVGLHGGQIVGATDLRDGEWHHVAVVLYEGSQPDVGTHVVVYIDGELESLSSRTLQKVKTRINTATHGVWVGRNVTTADGRFASHGSFFRGEVDELSIFHGALSQREILSLKSENRLPAR